MFSVRPRFSVRRLAAASAFSAIALMLTVHPAAAQTPAIGLASGGLGGEDTAANTGVSSYSLGFVFTANSAVSVTSLGYFYDPSFSKTAPFAKPHDVGLYTQDGTLLIHTSVTANGAQDGGFLYTDITPFALTPGTQYVVAGVTGADDPYLYAYNDSSGNSAITIDPAITYIQNRYAVSDTLAYPGSTEAGSDPGFFGPNFKTSPTGASTVPEPGQWAVFAFGALGLGTLIVRARRRQAAH